MDMYQKRKIRNEKKNNDGQKIFPSVGINWYPGHMAKTKKEIINDLGLIDVVIEVIDSRIPMSSRNPDIGEMTKNKKKIIVMNKIDLSDEKQNNLWANYLSKDGIKTVLVDSNTGKGVSEVLRQVENIMKDELEKSAAKGRIGKKIRVMILGIPNVGKSSFINRVAKNNRLEVANRPGVTRKKQWIRVNDKVELLDTPGVLWPKFNNNEVALNLAFTGTIKDDVLDKTEVAYQLLKFLIENYRDNLTQRYNLTNEYIEEKLNQEQAENVNIYEIMQEIGRRRGAIVSGGNIDDEKTAAIILEDFRSCKLGKITLERL